MTLFYTSVLGLKIVKTLPVSKSVGILNHWNLNFYLSAWLFKN